MSVAEDSLLSSVKAAGCMPVMLHTRSHALCIRHTYYALSQLAVQIPSGEQIGVVLEHLAFQYYQRWQQ